MLILTAECRAAIRAGDYENADRLLAELRTQVEASWAQSSPDERRSTASEVLELLSWARQTVLAKRSHAHRRLQQMHRNRAYLPAYGSAAGCVDFEG